MPLLKVLDPVHSDPGIDAVEDCTDKTSKHPHENETQKMQQSPALSLWVGGERDV